MTGTGRAREFYDRIPGDPASYAEVAGEVDSRFGPEEREKVASWISAPSDRSREALERFVAEDGYLVTTGQQPGLFTGPLYTIYKALSAVRLAEALEQRLGRPVVPLFWVASEDHDWDEVSHTYLPDLENELREIVLPPHGAQGSPPLHRIPVGEPLTEALSELRAILPDSDFRTRYMELLEDAYRPGTTLPDAFRAALEELLGPFGLCFVDAGDPGLKEASSAILLEELERSEAHEALLTDRATELEDAGYHVQVPILEGGVNLFLEGPDGRERIYRSGDGFRLHSSGTELTGEEIASRVADDPGVLSPNALLRPVVESRLLPTVSYVAGPGEGAYFAQLGPLFEAHGLGAPVVTPRASLTVVEGKNRKVLEKFGLEIPDLAGPFHEVAGRVARDEVPDDVRRALGSFRGAVGQHASTLASAVSDVDPTMKGAVETARNTAFQALDELEKKIVQAVKRQDEIALSQLEKAQIHLHPQGSPQERVLNVFYYLARYGPDFLPTVAERCAVDLGQAAS